METILDNLEEKYLSFKLGAEQREVLLSVFSLLQKPEFQECVISGRAGTGKTTISQIIIHFLEDYLKSDYVLVTPTHKSKRILAKNTDRDVTTIHKLLQLKPNIEILDLDLKSLKFCMQALDDNVPYKGIVLIDECSMINDDLYDTLVESCKKKQCKIIWQGDSKQLEPVTQTKISKPFRGENVFELTQVYRQKNDNPILDILEVLRTKPIFEFKNIKSENGSLIIYDSWKNLLNDKINLFKESLKNEEPNEVKILAYTNKRVEAFNQVIRDQLFNEPCEFEPGDFLMGYDNTNYRGDKITYQIDNSNDFRVVSAEWTTKYIGGQSLNGWNLELYDYDREEYISVFVLSKYNNVNDIEKLAYKIEHIRQSAVLCNNFFEKKTLWKDYYKLIESFVLPFDLYYENRLVKKKTIDYGYAMTVHKSQASTYDNVLVDMGNINKCLNKVELRQLQYVALSRTRNDVYMLV